MSAAESHLPYAATPPHAAPAGGPATVLLVEDDRAIRRYLQVTLERAGFRVVVASDGLEAMKAALNAPVDAVVTDAIMPHLDGHALCRFLRRHPKLKGLPVVLLSGSEHSAPNVAADERADAYLTKPVRPSQLAGCLTALIERAVV